MNRCELGYCVWVLWYRLWDSPITSPPWKSRKWWKEHKRELSVGTNVCEIELNPHTASLTPIPYELE